MRLSPLDIRNQQFPRSFRGFNPDAVNSFRELLANELEELLRQNSDYAGRIKRLEEQVEGYAKIERAINETLILAQKTAEEARGNARKEAELIVQEAGMRAEQEQGEIRKRFAQLKTDLSALQGQRDVFFARFKGLLTTQLNLLGTLSGELQDQFDKIDIAPAAGLSAESEGAGDISTGGENASTDKGTELQV